MAKDDLAQDHHQRNLDPHHSRGPNHSPGLNHSLGLNHSRGHNLSQGPNLCHLCRDPNHHQDLHRRSGRSRRPDDLPAPLYLVNLEYLPDQSHDQLRDRSQRHRSQNLSRKPQAMAPSDPVDQGLHHREEELDDQEALSFRTSKRRLDLPALDKGQVDLVDLVDLVAPAAPAAPVARLAPVDRVVQAVPADRVAPAAQAAPAAQVALSAPVDQVVLVVQVAQVVPAEEEYQVEATRSRLGFLPTRLSMTSIMPRLRSETM